MIDDSDLTNVAEGDYKPEGGKLSAPLLHCLTSKSAARFDQMWTFPGLHGGNTHEINIYFKL